MEVVMSDPGTWGLIIKGAAVLVGAGAAGSSVQQSTQSRKAAKSSAEGAVQRQQKAATALKEAEEGASAQAQARITERKRRVTSGSKSIYTSPLGIAGEANLARKTLLGQ